MSQLAANQMVYFFPTGNTAVFRDGEQVPELQVPWLRLVAEFFQAQGADPTQFTFLMPDGETVEMFMTENGWNWEPVERNSWKAFLDQIRSEYKK